MWLWNNMWFNLLILFCNSEYFTFTHFKNIAYQFISNFKMLYTNLTKIRTLNNYKPLDLFFQIKKWHYYWINKIFDSLIIKKRWFKLHRTLKCILHQFRFLQRFFFISLHFTSFSLKRIIINACGSLLSQNVMRQGNIWIKGWGELTALTLWNTVRQFLFLPFRLKKMWTLTLKKTVIYF